jgi:hypothetical protein
MSKVKMLVDVVAEVKKEAPEDVPNWNSKLAESKVNLKNQLAKGRKLPLGTEAHPLEDFAFNYSVQRDVRAGHVMNIMKKFDPRVCCPVSAVRRSDSKTLYIFDGQHRAVSLALLGYDNIPVTIVETDEPAFDAEAFEIVNDSGILRAGTEEIHRCLLHRYKMGETETERVATAHSVQKVFDECEIDLEPKRVRKSSGKCGPNKHYFSHFDYAYKGIKMAGEAGLREALKAIKQVYGDEEGGEINQGLFIGLMKQYQMGSEAKRLNRLPDDWMTKMLEAIKKVCPSTVLVHSAAKKQWQHANGVGWDAPVAMAHLLREVYLLEDGTFEPSYMPNVTLKLEEGNIATESEAQTAFNKYVK